MHPHAMLAQYMHPLQTSTLFFKGILKGLLVDPLVFVVTLHPGWGCTFVVILFLACAWKM